MQTSELPCSNKQLKFGMLIDSLGSPCFLLVPSICPTKQQKHLVSEQPYSGSCRNIRVITRSFKMVLNTVCASKRPGLWASLTADLNMLISHEVHCKTTSSSVCQINHTLAHQGLLTLLIMSAWLLYSERAYLKVVSSDMIWGLAFLPQSFHGKAGFGSQICGSGLCLVPFVSVQATHLQSPQPLEYRHLPSLP